MAESWVSKRLFKYRSDSFVANSWNGTSAAPVLALAYAALQIHGAAGYGRALPLERMARAARMFAIGGGTVEMMRNLIADRIPPTRLDVRR